MSTINEGTMILIGVTATLFAATVATVHWMAGSFTKATPYHFGKLAEVAGGDSEARSKVRDLLKEKKVTLRDVYICRNEIEEIVGRKAAAQALAQLG